MSTTTKFHAGDRLRRVIAEIFDSQHDAGEWFSQNAKSGSQGSVNRWIKKEQFSPTIMDSLRALAKRGVNPDYFQYPHVTDWRHKPADLTDEDKDLIIQYQKDIIQLQKLVQGLEEEIEELRDKNEKLKQML